MKVTLAGMGPGGMEWLLPEAGKALERADLVIGSERLLQALPSGLGAERYVSVRPEETGRRLAQGGWDNAVVLFSGDSGFYSGASGLLEVLKGTDSLRSLSNEVEVIPGISSLQLFASRLRASWQDWSLLSAHGRSCDLMKALSLGKPVFLLTGGGKAAAAVLRQLCDAGLGCLLVTVGEALTYPEERIRRGTAQEMAEQEFAALNVMLIEPDPSRMPHLRTPGIPDHEWIRGRVPMTKQEVRAVILAKLSVCPRDILWDIGSGTGSVAVEMALCAREVWAVEKNPEACSLIRQNQERFCAWNLQIAEGEAPEALRSLPVPDAVFVGGSGGKLEEILDEITLIAPRARILISAIALETVSCALRWMQRHGKSPEVCQIAVSNTQAAGNLHLLKANNPVFLITSA